MEQSNLAHCPISGIAPAPRGRHRQGLVVQTANSSWSNVGKSLQLVLLGALLSNASNADIRFREVASEAGIDFRHDASKGSAKHLPEAMGSGVAMLDFDGDGRLDLYFVNGANLDELATGSSSAKSDPRYWNRLYRNVGNWRFEDATASAGVAGRGYGMGVATGDYDGDGDIDLFVSNFGPDILFRNEGDGTFREASAEAGIGGPGWSAGAAFLDFDGDGWLDLFVATYLDWSFSKSRPCGDSLPDRGSYCHPRLFDPVQHTLYRNLGNGRFRDVSSETNISDHAGKGLGVAVNDYDGDGWTDVFVANDSYPQQLFRNLGGTGFTELAVKAGAAYDAEGQEYAGMGVVWSDSDRDTRPDLLVNALGRQGYWLYRNANGAFEPVSDSSGISALSELRSGWGMGLADFDNDSWRDLFVAQGHVMDDIGDSDGALLHEEPLMLARNLFGRYYDVSSRAGSVFDRRFAARGAAFGDLDADGRVDVAVNVNDGAALLLRNESAAGESITVRLRGVGGNRYAIGALVTVKSTANTVQSAYSGEAGSYLSANSFDLHFGLGEGGRCAAVEIIWPDGSHEVLDDVDHELLVISPSVQSK